ncbi:DLA class II histocompatibility antigen, DR-1 beta chain-like isoform X2 [Mobula birostris]|uniref:DLA class II histocompatibility antigen, DR-1 beta chain-like isoform X2 n=1 Tax=Mobula birostris TaxID=1983395 RepID=UPI003B27F468
MWGMMPSPRTVSQLLLPLSQEPPAGVRRRRSPSLLAAFLLLLLHNGSIALVKPTITITSRHMKNRENNLALTCQVHGFYPKKIHAMWLRNGVAIDREVLNTSILPNRDGTFQVRLQVEIDPGKGDTYTCEIEHLSVPDKLHAVWVPKNTYPVYGYVIGIIAGIIGILTAVFGGMIRWKAHHGCGSQRGMNWIQGFICSNASASVTHPELCSHGENDRLCEELGQMPRPASECTTEV